MNTYPCRPHMRRAALALVGLALAASACGSEAGQEKAAGPKSQGNDSTVVLDSTAQRLAGIELVTAASASSDALVATGTIEYDENRASVVAPRAEARVVSVSTDLGRSVRAGDALAVLESTEVGQIRGELAGARARADVAGRNYERERRLYEQSITSQKEVLEAEGEYRVAAAEAAAAAGRLRSIGAGGGAAGRFTLSAPVSGTVVARSAMPGQVAGPATALFTVADLRHLWLTVDVYEQDLSRVREGARAAVRPRALDGQAFPGRVTYAGGVVDRDTRTFKVRVEVDNPTLRLRPGMFAEVRIDAPAATAPSAARVVVPEVAVQEVNGAPAVFVATDRPGHYVVRRVVRGGQVGEDGRAITHGLRAGERVVAKGAFQLKAELTKGSFGEED